MFGSGGGERLAAELGVPLLGRVPLDPLLRECGDAGEPLMIAAPESARRAQGCAGSPKRLAALERGSIVKPLPVLS